MLRILCGEEPENLLNTATHVFKLEFQNEWFNDPLVEEMVLDIDKTKHIKDSVFDSPVLDIISAPELSGGVKGLILILKSELLKSYSAMRSSIFGDNCVKWIIKLSYLTDFTIYMSHYLDFYFGGNYSEGFEGFESTPINAVGKNNEPLRTCGEIMQYFLDNDAFEYEYSEHDTNEMNSLQKLSNRHQDIDSLKVQKQPSYVIPMDHPYSIALGNLTDKLYLAKTDTERDAIVKEIRNLDSMYFGKK